MIDWWLVIGLIGGGVYWDSQERKRKRLEDKIDEIQSKLDNLDTKANMALNLCKQNTKYFTIT